MAPPGVEGKEDEIAGSSDQHQVAGSAASSSETKTPPRWKPHMAPKDSDTPWAALFMTYINFLVLISFGYMRNFIDWILGREFVMKPKGYAPLLNDFEHFYTRRLYMRFHDCWSRPICSSPGAYIDVMERKIRDSGVICEFTGQTIRALNLGSYNYLGFADRGPWTDDVCESVRRNGIGLCSARAEYGTHTLHRELERMVAKFVGKEDSMVFGMGYATNSTTIPALVEKGCLILSDSLNHASIVAGCKASGAKVRVFKHNDPADLEVQLRDSIAEGQPRTHRPWRKILIIVEGIYSMEGEICRLKEVVEIKKKYKAYLYVDEAHSIGALGKSGRGVCEHWGVNPADVDILMGTFTKSFDSVGGYIAADAKIIAYLRQNSWAQLYSTSMSPPCVTMIMSALKVITGEDGTNEGKRRIAALADNSNYFRRRLRELGFQVFGDEDSPIIVQMLYNPAGMGSFSRYCLKRGVAVVIAGFPATQLLLSRVRYCVSASHTIADLESGLKMISEVGDHVMVKYDK